MEFGEVKTNPNETSLLYHNWKWDLEKLKQIWTQYLSQKVEQLSIFVKTSRMKVWHDLKSWLKVNNDIQVKTQSKNITHLRRL